MLFCLPKDSGVAFFSILNFWQDFIDWTEVLKYGGLELV